MEFLILLKLVLLPCLIQGQELEINETQSRENVDLERPQDEAPPKVVNHNEFFVDYAKSSHENILKELKDLHNNCCLWAAQGRCLTSPNALWMLNNCAESCQNWTCLVASFPTFDQSYRNGVSLDDESHSEPSKQPSGGDNDIQCCAWASLGECDKNPDYMNGNCSSACAENGCKQLSSKATVQALKRKIFSSLEENSAEKQRPRYAERQPLLYKPYIPNYLLNVPHPFAIPLNPYSVPPNPTQFNIPSQEQHVAANLLAEKQTSQSSQEPLVLPPGLYYPHQNGQEHLNQLDTQLPLPPKFNGFNSNLFWASNTNHTVKTVTEGQKVRDYDEAPPTYPTPTTSSFPVPKTNSSEIPLIRFLPPPQFSEDKNLPDSAKEETKWSKQYYSIKEGQEFHPKCCYWASMGYCDNQPVWMQDHCSLSCKHNGCRSNPTRGCTGKELCALSKFGIRQRLCVCQDKLFGQVCSANHNYTNLHGHRCHS